MRSLDPTPRFKKDLKKMSRKYRDLEKNYQREIRKVVKEGPEGGCRMAGMKDRAPVFKLRLAVGGKGKRGGARVIYFCDDRKVVPLFVYAKGAKADIPTKEINDALVAATRDDDVSRG